MENLNDQHAYCIICHNNVPILKRLLALLDDPRNDIYIHVDKKAVDFPMEECAAVVKRASVTYIPRRSVNWGGASMVWAELDLLRAAVKTPHSYYHLLSGVDMPLKTQDEIHRFFREKQGAEFMSFDHHAMETGNFLDRVQYYYIFWDAYGRNRRRRPLWWMERLQLAAQKCLGMDRTKHAPVTFYKGAQWFSITHELAVYLLSQEECIHRYFRMSCCADELVLQTVAMASPYRDRVVDDDLRLIDWDRGNPYTYTAEDFDWLMASDRLFARKFDSEKDMRVVERIYQTLVARQSEGGPARAANTEE